MGNSSKFKHYSMGIAAVDYVTGDDTLEIFLSEHLSDYSGYIADKDRKKDLLGGDSLSSLGGVLTGKLDRSVTIHARWLKDGNDNRVSPPNVKKGETLNVYKFGDTDRYYWTTALNETNVRKQESVAYAVSNETKHGATVTDKNSYWTKIDTINKKVKIIKTNKNDGEPAAWDIDINTKTGVLFIEDDRGNRIEIKDKSITLSSGTVNVNANNINLKAGNTVLSGGNVVFDSTCSFNKSVTMNGNAKTNVGPHGHTHVVL
jgi:hypothetical protein